MSKAYQYKRQYPTEEKLDDKQKEMLNQMLKPYCDFARYLAKEIGTDEANKIVNAIFNYQMRGLFYGQMIM